MLINSMVYSIYTIPTVTILSLEDEMQKKAIQEVTANSYTTWKCVKVTSLKLFDEMISLKVIPIWRGIRLVRVADYVDDRMTDPSDAAQRDVEGFLYLDQIAERMTKILQTHALQVSLKDIFDGIVLDDKGQSFNVYGSPRHRRHRNNMMMAMVFGVTALGAVMVPVGFQVLSVISGKALLLAKMALLLASINGLKRIANSGVHYGLYQVPHDPYGYPHGYYDRGDAQHPRNVPNPMANRIDDV
ncbi:uncharacterized protein LOC129913157 [Episyrphus balteatus]|uniref:uncharacterized protein LOC129913157 n=1 Tax=Episyrphus balteatus TaxID=286459 RepID=UPI00248548DA|nr:uncharacterized protein LOC129913157 [Episyrphus balteatus]